VSVSVWVGRFIVIFCTIIGSGGFWAYIQKKDTKKDATDRLIMGLAYNLLVELGMKYMDRGSITRDEYEDYLKYFHNPYKELGGNGVADRIMQGVSRLPLRSHSEYGDIFDDPEERRFIQNVRVRTPDGEER
jgi:hypothetical protein